MGGDGNNHIQAFIGQAGNRLINAADHRIEGAGNIGGNAMKLTNQGLIVANNSGAALVLDPDDAADGFINTGTLRAQDGARLILGGGSYTNTGGQIEALDGSFVDLAHSTVGGGTLTSVGSGVIRNYAGYGNTLSDVTLAGRLEVQTNSILHLTGTFTNTGRVDMGGGTSVIRVADGTTLTGGGKVVMGGDGNNHIQAFIGQAGNRLINAADHRIEGAGNIGGNAMKLTNQGLIVANAAAPLIIDPYDSPDGFYNRGVLRVESTSTLIFAAGPGNNLVQDGASARTEVFGKLTAPLLDLQAGVLTGSGTVVGAVENSGGHVSPGYGVGSLYLTGSFVQTALGSLDIQLGALDGHDLFAITGTANLGGTLALSCYGDCRYYVGDEITILTSGGARSGMFSAVSYSGFLTGEFAVLYGANDVRLKVLADVTPVPEPETWAMLLVGLGLVGLMARRRRG